MSRNHIRAMALGTIITSLGLSLGLATGLAHAGPSVRFGMDFALSDSGAPNAHEIGPSIAVGERIGPIEVSADYAYLSFFDPDTSANGISRLGLNLRADVFRSTNTHCFRGLACTRGSAVYAELGVAERFGQWHLDANTVAPETDRQREGHFGIGIELDNRLVPYRYGWQLGLRFAAAPRDVTSAACRGAGCGIGGMTTSTTDRSVLVEWTFLLGQ